MTERPRNSLPRRYGVGRDGRYGRERTLSTFAIYMLHELHYPILKDLGLTETEAIVYEVLLEQGPKPAKDLVIPSGLSRGNVYNAVTALAKKGLVTEKQGIKTIFEASPPSHLATLLEREQSKLKQINTSFQSVLPQLSQEFSFSTGKPVIQMFSGFEGAEKAIMDTLEPGQEIMTYLDVGAMLPEISKLNAKYLKQRIEKQINKRIIVEDSPASRQFFATQNTPFTEVKFIKNFPGGFQTSMQIYANTVLYLTMNPDNQISVIIRDQHIFDMHQAHFNYLWNYAALRADEDPGSKAT